MNDARGPPTLAIRRAHQAEGEAGAEHAEHGGGRGRGPGELAVGEAPDAEGRRPDGGEGEHPRVTTSEPYFWGWAWRVAGQAVEERRQQHHGHADGGVPPPPEDPRLTNTTPMKPTRMPRRCQTRRPVEEQGADQTGEERHHAVEHAGDRRVDVLLGQREGVKGMVTQGDREDHQHLAVGGLDLAPRPRAGRQALRPRA